MTMTAVFFFRFTIFVLLCTKLHWQETSPPSKEDTLSALPPVFPEPLIRVLSLARFRHKGCRRLCSIASPHFRRKPALCIPVCVLQDAWWQEDGWQARKEQQRQKSRLEWEVKLKSGASNKLQRSHAVPVNCILTQLLDDRQRNRKTLATVLH